MSRFADTFSQPLFMGDGVYGLSAEAFTTEEAAWAVFLDSEGEERDRWTISPDRVRFRPTGEDDHGDFGLGQMAWWTGASGRGSKPIWLFERRPAGRKAA